MARRVFYSFHYESDVSRVAQVRNIGVIEANSPAADNDWETVTKGGDKAIRDWIADQMKGRSCTVVLVGSETAGRKWINHEIIESWNKGMGVVGIYIHGLKNLDGYISDKGKNPFDFITYNGLTKPPSIPKGPLPFTFGGSGLTKPPSIPKGPLPFTFGGSGLTKLSSIVKCYNPVGRNSKERYAWIEKRLAIAIEVAIQIRKTHPYLVF